MTTLTQFQELINDIKDDDLLGVAEGLLKDIILIQDMKERIEKLEEGLSEGKRAAFWFFAMGLEREQVDLATNTVIGRRRTLKDLEERKKKEAKPEDSKEQALEI